MLNQQDISTDNSIEELQAILDELHKEKQKQDIEKKEKERAVEFVKSLLLAFADFIDRFCG